MNVPMFALLAIAGVALAPKADTPATPKLEGVWTAESMESNGKAVPAGAAALMRFNFKGEKVVIRGNRQDESEEEMDFKVDPEKKPAQLVLTGKGKPINAIYAFEGDKLKLCVRREGSSKGFPTEFKSTPESELVFIVLKREKP